MEFVFHWEVGSTPTTPLGRVVEIVYAEVNQHLNSLVLFTDKLGNSVLSFVFLSSQRLNTVKKEAA